jgi:hypothetical protein
MEQTGIVPSERIADKIHVIRGRKVMLDRDLAELYGVKTHVLNQAVKRNLERFPEDFMFKLGQDEHKNLISQIVISSSGRKNDGNLKSQSVTSSWGGKRKLPLAFTEQGVAMLSGVLNSPRAILVNIQIIRTFTKLRELLSENEQLRLKIEAMEQKYDKHFKAVFDAIRQLLAEPPASTEEIGFKPL